MTNNSQTIQKINYYNKYDWGALKLEFMQGPWPTVSEFRRFKVMPDSKTNNHITSRTTGWSQEKRELLAQAAQNAGAELLEQKTEDIKDVMKRQAKLARWMQLKGARSLKTLDPDNVDEARKLITSGLDEERIALGVGQGKRSATSLTQVNVNLPKTRFDKLLDEASYEELIKFLAEVRQERARRAEQN